MYHIRIPKEKWTCEKCHGPVRTLPEGAKGSDHIGICDSCNILWGGMGIIEVSHSLWEDWNERQKWRKHYE